MKVSDRVHQIAEELAGTLFLNGSGEAADRLVLTQDEPHRDLGGWGITGAVRAIERYLKDLPELKP